MSASRNSELERHHEVAHRHQRGADDHGLALPKPAVGQEPAEDRGEIHESCVETVDLRRQRLHAERAEQRFEACFQGGEADDLLRVLGLERVFHHVQHEQRAHAVVGEALPHFGGEEIGQAARVAEKVAGIFACSTHGLVSRMRCSASAISAYARVFDALWHEAVHR